MPKDSNPKESGQARLRLQTKLWERQQKAAPPPPPPPPPKPAPTQAEKLEQGVRAYPRTFNEYMEEQILKAKQFRHMWDRLDHDGGKEKMPEELWNCFYVEPWDEWNWSLTKLVEITTSIKMHTDFKTKWRSEEGYIDRVFDTMRNTHDQLRAAHDRWGDLKNGLFCNPCGVSESMYIAMAYLWDDNIDWLDVLSMTKLSRLAWNIMLKEEQTLPVEKQMVLSVQPLLIFHQNVMKLFEIRRVAEEKDVGAYDCDFLDLVDGDSEQCSAAFHYGIVSTAQALKKTWNVNKHDVPSFLWDYITCSLRVAWHTTEMDGHPMDTMEEFFEPKTFWRFLDAYNVATLAFILSKQYATTLCLGPCEWVRELRKDMQERHAAPKPTPKKKKWKRPEWESTWIINTPENVMKLVFLQIKERGRVPSLRICSNCDVLANTKVCEGCWIHEDTCEVCVYNEPSDWNPKVAWKPMARYCSKKCQREDWDSHQHVCPRYDIACEDLEQHYEEKNRRTKGGYFWIRKCCAHTL